MKFDCGIRIEDDVEALLFDLDGTLVDNMHLHIDAWIAAGVEFDIPIVGKMITINAGIPTRQLITKLAQENDWKVDQQAFTLSKQRLYKEIKAAAGPSKKIQEIIDIADYYYGKLPMTIGTGSSRSNALAALSDAGILDWFDLVVSADDVEHPKPHPEVWLKASDYINVDPSRCLVFEDGEKGMEAAEAAGMMWIDVRDYIM